MRYSGSMIIVPFYSSECLLLFKYYHNIIIIVISDKMNRVFYEFYIFNNKDKLLFYLDFDNLKENSNEDPSLSIHIPSTIHQPKY